MSIKYTICIYFVFRIVYSKLECKNSNNLKRKFECVISNYIPNKENNILNISYNNCSSIPSKHDTNKKMCKKITKKVITSRSNPSTDRLNNQKSNVTFIPQTNKKLPSNRLAYITASKTGKDNLISKKNLSLKILPSNLEENLRKKIRLGVIPYGILNSNYKNDSKNSKDSIFFEEKPENLFIVNNELNYYYNYNLKDLLNCRGVSGMSGKCKSGNDGVYMVSRCNKASFKDGGSVYKVNSFKDGFNEVDCDEGGVNDSGNFVKVTTLKEGANELGSDVGVNDSGNFVKVTTLKEGVNEGRSDVGVNDKESILKVSTIKEGVNELGSDVGVNDKKSIPKVSSIKGGVKEQRSDYKGVNENGSDFKYNSIKRGVNELESHYKGFKELGSDFKGVNEQGSDYGGFNELGSHYKYNSIKRGVNKLGSHYKGFKEFGSDFKGVNEQGSDYGGFKQQRSSYRSFKEKRSINRSVNDKYIINNYNNIKRSLKDKDSFFNGNIYRLGKNEDSNWFSDYFNLKM
ncbi:hypothetical protein CWI37_0818p0020 [Hamiltosporidium tvaerminnensis]|uniref:Uncharacterized protein n=1 Tax=Hamiltosporidium tvaerminnensis TaxID=1176355 RepID=A0A4Q9L2I0_9MICR|nr:hypothetical protein CWI37_0818p0020 [Hamiltosporidium tvaerminnensis]